MNFQKSNLLVFVSFFPVFVLRSNLNQFEIIISIIIFVIPFFFLNYLVVEKKIFKKNFLNVYFSIILVFGIDNNLGIWNGLIQPFRFNLMEVFKIIYIPGILVYLTLIILFFFIFKLTEKNFKNVILVFLVSIFIFNIFDQTKSYKKIKNFAKRDQVNKYEDIDVVIIFDEMSGLNSFASKNDEKNSFNKLAIKVFEKYNFEYYKNINSFSPNSVTSIASLLNFSTDNDIRKKVTSISENYFYEYELNKNLFFKKYKNISVFQNIHIDYCLFKNISKCETYNPFKQKIFLDGFKNSYLSKVISIWKLNGSISSAILWRTLRQFGIIDSLLEPEGHKISFNDFFNKIESDINSQKFDLVFAHTLVPHKPYGFNKNCKYDGKLSLGNTFYSKQQHINQHNIERKCVFQFLNGFLKNLNEKDLLDKINLTILSDHGSRITKDKDSSLSVIFGNRSKKTKSKEFIEEVISQKIFFEQFKN